MTTQLEAFPKTTMEVLEQLRCLHVLEVEKARDSLDALSDDEKIAKRYDKAEARLHDAQQLVREIDSAITALQGMPDPVTGEVHNAAPKPASAPDNPTPAPLAAVPETDPATGGEVDAPRMVRAIYPGDPDAHETEVGQFTRYGELVADYGSAVGIEVTMGEYEVVGENGPRDLGAAIAPADYGAWLEVRPAVVEAAS